MKMQVFFHRKVDVTNDEKDRITRTIDTSPFVGKLKAPADTYHSHFGYRKVAVWRRTDDGMEVLYFGKRENAPLLSKCQRGRNL
jgi:hypothetical protein